MIYPLDNRSYEKNLFINVRLTVSVAKVQNNVEINVGIISSIIPE